tara:strand:- start:208 stop:534 length:327 start_codon:yes stop_codon:yes gene_type:complete
MSDTVKLHVTDRTGQEHEVEAIVGFTIKDAIARNLQLDHFGDCGGCCACATCHVYVDDNYISKLEKIDEEELEMIEMSSDQRENSRLGCQVPITEDMDGMKLVVAQDI